MNDALRDELTALGDVYRSLLELHDDDAQRRVLLAVAVLLGIDNLRGMG